MKLTIANIFLAVVVPLAAAADDAEDDGAFHPKEAWGMVVSVEPGDVLHVRAEPSPSGRMIGALPHDADGFEVLRCVTPAAGGRWCLIRFARREGWVNARHIAIYGDA